MPSVGLFIPTSAPDATPEMLIPFGQRAEAAGLASIWLPDRIVFAGADPLIGLAALAATTTRALLGTSVLLGTLRPPALLAKMLATLDVLSDGRLTLGLGVGSRPDDFASVELPFARRGSRADETIEILRLAWSGAPLQYQGRHYQLDVGPVGPRPAQPGGPPIWLGGSAEAALDRAGRMAQGYIAGSAGGPAGVARVAARVKESARAAGRDPAEVTIAALVRASVDENVERALERALANARHYRPGTSGENPAAMLLGAPAACIERAQAYFAAGVDVLIVGPVSADLGHLDRLLGEVLMRL